MGLLAEKPEPCCSCALVGPGQAKPGVRNHFKVALGAGAALAGLDAISCRMIRSFLIVGYGGPTLE